MPALAKKVLVMFATHQSFLEPPVMRLVAAAGAGATGAAAAGVVAAVAVAVVVAGAGATGAAAATSAWRDTVCERFMGSWSYIKG